MRHLNRGRKLNRTSSHRKALFRNLAIALFNKGRIITTPAKAKETRPFAERLITLAKRGYDDVAARRRAIRLLHNPGVVSYLFKEIGPRFKERQGGYTRILHLARTRVGDGARQVLFEMVEGGKPASKRAQEPVATVETTLLPAPSAVNTGESTESTPTPQTETDSADSTGTAVGNENVLRVPEQAAGNDDMPAPAAEPKPEDVSAAPADPAAQGGEKPAD